MPTYRTPDVYIEEISVFPPSVAEVETAIPAFIGYTANTTLITAGDLVNAPRRVKSLLEFESYYGRGPSYTVTRANLDEAGNFLSADIANSYVMYDSLRLYYDNGGGDCYIVSTGAYKSAGSPVDRDELKAGVQAVAKVDEPTILLFPDAATLGPDDLAAVQQEALKQCGELKDRVAVLDLRQGDPNGASFRDKIGINNLKYGAGYTPWLKLNYSKNVGYAQVRDKVFVNGIQTPLTDLTSEPAILAALAALDQLAADGTTLAAAVTALAGAGETLSSAFAKLLAAYKTTPTPTTGAALFEFVFGIARLVDGLVDVSPLSNAKLVADINTAIAGTLKPAFATLIALEKELAAALNALAADSYTVEWDQNTPPATAAWGAIFGASAPDASTGNFAGATAPALIDDALPGLQKAFSIASRAVAGIVTAIANYRALNEQTLLENFTPYRNVIKGIGSTLTMCPPSGAIAGIYALVDSQRGVWKAPANVSLNGVIAPAASFTTSETDALNVDATGGKSINAIRAFVGKGTLVWGARTLAGNDNEWRYVSVRRFFNMVEESIKKSTYWAVFEPNDANTWVKVRGMIENYLTQKWREGALAGATTKDAFFVRCGLGVTMNAQDILEGRMNVEIGMAVVRPAEFIILKFSHKLQTS
ncbi:MAG: phage tail sheath subtilisin-like domain-containing protein [Azonexus sp.]|nr:phage tail sheath subtilisin-like domain-containing protein [Azonexus sp.]